MTLGRLRLNLSDSDRGGIETIGLNLSDSDRGGKNAGVE